jgi:hypothetical protein
MTQTSDNEDELKRQLEQRRTLKTGSVPADFVYAGIEDFVLQHGEWHRSAHKTARVAVQKACFGNALANAFVLGYRYVEGFSLTPKMVPIHHAWNLTEDDELYDTTWMNTGLAYIGVEFSTGRADNAIWFDDGTVLDNPFDRKLYRQRWTGENYKLIWRKSKMRRKAMRALLTP